jgi:hypothetical protein
MSSPKVAHGRRRQLSPSEISLSPALTQRVAAEEEEVEAEEGPRRARPLASGRGEKG